MAKSVEKGAASSNAVDDETFRAFVRLAAEANEVCEKANSAKKRLRKQIKAAGIQLGDFDAVMKMTDWGRSEVREHFDRRTLYAKWLNLPVGSQGEMFTSGSENSETGAETQGDVVFAKAYQAGVMGKAADCPEEYLDQSTKWAEGYKAGQDSLAMELINKNKATAE